MRQSGRVLYASMKQCVACRQSRPLANFNRNRRQKDGLHYYCKPCLAVHTRSYYVRNAEKLRRKSATWYARNKTSERALILERSRRSYWKNVESERRRSRAKYWGNLKRERVRARKNTRRYRLRYPERVLANNHRRRVLLMGAAFVEHVDRLILARRDNWRCHICSGRVTRKNWSIDHLVALTRGGEHSYKNTALAHRSCNASRGADRFPAPALARSAA